MADTPSFPIAAGAADEILSFTRFDTNLGTGNVTKIIERVNVTQGTKSYIDTDGAAYTVTGTVADKPLRVQIGGENVASADLDDAGGAADLPNAPAEANHAEIHVYDTAGIVFTITGVDPAGTAGNPTSGTRVAAGATFELESKSEIDNFRFSNLGPNPTSGVGIYIEYFNFGDSFSGVTD